MDVFEEKIWTIFNGLEVEQKISIVERLCKSLIDEGEGVPLPPKKKAKGSHRWKSAYWMKSLESFDPKGKGTDCIVGHYFRDIKEQLGKDDEFVIGTRHMPKFYYVCARKDGNTASVGDGNNKMHDVENAEVLHFAKNFKELRDILKAR